jgi:GT2 family glycosyltransferase/glycosyltransferase involved in cell wall biosynthesis
LNIEIGKVSEIYSQTSLSTPRVLIAVPFYKNEDLVPTLVGSLIDCAADIAAIGGEVLFLDDSPDYAPLGEALAAILPKARAAFSCRVVRNPANLGFVKTMNRAIAEAVERRLDIVLLNSDVIVHPGALTEMARVARLDAMIGFVNPRSDNATLATLPVEHRVDVRGSGFDLAPFAALAARLPEFSYIPTAVGFCMLIRWHILAEFGGFDEVFGAGYNEENDLVMRAGRCGYRAALANRAFVQHEGEGSFSSAEVPKAAWELANRAILDARYPEYSAFTSAYFVSPEARAEQLLSTLIPDDAGRLDLAFDFSSFAARHNGTYQVGRQLLGAAVRHWSDRFNIHVLCSPEIYDFHDYGALDVERCDPDGPERFAVIFREGQPYDWKSIERLVTKGAVIGVHMLDTISIDCSQLTSQALFDTWQFVFSHADFFVAPSAQSMAQIALRFQISARMTRVCSLLSLDLRDYLLGVAAGGKDKAPGGQPTLLVIGNHFPHKYLVPTANALAHAFPDRKVLALGQAKPGLSPPFNPYGLPELSSVVNLVGIDVGNHSDGEFAAFYADADVIVFPSHYEGFGIPLLNALSLRRPIFVRRLPVFEELWHGLARNPNIHFYETTADLVRRLEHIPAWQDTGIEPPAERGIDRSARDILAGIEAALPEVEYRVVVDRLRAVQLIAALTPPAAAPPPPPDPIPQPLPPPEPPLPEAPLPEPPLPEPPPPEPASVVAARFAAARFEWAAGHLFAIGPVYALIRLSFRIVRPILRLARSVARRLR